MKILNKKKLLWNEIAGFDDAWKFAFPFVREEDATLPTVRYLPVVGSRYFSAQTRLLILGESHYWDSEKQTGADSDPWDFHFTRQVFDGVESAIEIGSRTWGQFWKRLDSLVSNSVERNEIKAAEGWKEVAFLNYVPGVIGDTSRVSPNPMNWKQARKQFDSVLNFLQPHLILVLGCRAWNQLYMEDNTGWKCDTIDVSSPINPKFSRQRDVWIFPSMNNNRPDVILTWVYHPSVSIDSAESMCEILTQLRDKLKMVDDYVARR